jgi:GTP pyrophosphokinase
MQIVVDSRLRELIDELPDGATGVVGTRLLTAYEFAHDHYGESRNGLGISLLAHSVGVVETMHGLRMGDDALVAALFNHIDVEDAAFAEIKARFGRNVTDILRNLHRLNTFTQSGQSSNERTLEAVRRAVLTVVKGDVRVVLLRLAICLDDLKGVAKLPPERQIPVALDARNIYAPLANRLGIWQLKWELEDFAFRYLQPDQYAEIVAALDEKRIERDKRVKAARDKLSEQLGRLDIHAAVTGRPKHIFSIYRKMERKKVSFAEVYDAHALRVIIAEDDPEKPGLTEEARKQAKYTQCYRVLGVVHDIWDAVSDEFDDYIQHPKPNGYRSLHTTVYDENGHLLEVQIRTRLMHAEAEQGIAAHWAYKEGGRPSPAMTKQVESLRNLLGTMTNATPSNKEEAPSNESIAEEVLADRIYVFTPKGDLLDLPLGATPIDFAYMVHTQVGHRTRGAKVNGKMVGLTHQLQSGDNVTIVTDKYPKPSRDWMNPNSGYTASARSRSRIRQWFRQNERPQNIEFGRSIVDRELRRLKIGRTITVDDLALHFKFDNIDDFLANVGFGDISVSQIEGALALFQRDLRISQAALTEEDDFEDEPLDVAPIRPKKGGLTILGVDGLHTTIAKCCRPIAPEPIVGYITRGRGITIHHNDCKQVQAKLASEPERIIEADWGAQTGTFAVPYRVEAYRDTNLVTKIADIIKGQNINLLQSKTTHKGQLTSVYILAEVNGVDQATWIKNRLEKIDTVVSVRGRHP